MKLVSHYLQKISGVEIFPILSLLFFIVFFIVVVWVVYKTDKTVYEEMENLPLDNKSVN